MEVRSWKEAISRVLTRGTRTVGDRACRAQRRVAGVRPQEPQELLREGRVARGVQLHTIQFRTTKNRGIPRLGSGGEGGNILLGSEGGPQRMRDG